MIEVVRRRPVDEAPEQLWALIEPIERLPEWFGFAERAEHLEGSGVGRRQRIHGRWGNKESEVDQRVTRYEPGRVLEWVHEAERLEGAPAPKFARSTTLTIRLEPVAGGTVVSLESRQEPASIARGLVLRTMGRREVKRRLESSLERLAGLARR